jgi:hypothetical protein
MQAGYDNADTVIAKGLEPKPVDDTARQIEID